MFTYDATSLVPNLDESIRNLMGVAKNVRTDQLGRQLTPPADVKPGDRVAFLMRPENQQILQRMGRVNPEAAQQAIQFAATADATALEQQSKEAEQVSRTFQALLDTDDAASRNTFLSKQITELEEQGKPTDKLRELIGKSFDEQTLAARRNVILAGDYKLLADNGMQAMKDALEITNARLGIIEKQQDIQRKAREDALGKETDVAGLRKEFTTLSDPFIKVRDAYARVRQSASNPSPAGDLALIFNYVKMLDPASTVRESEFEAAAAAGSFGDRVKAAISRVKDGQPLAPEQRADFLQRSSELYQSQKASHQQLRSSYTDHATRRGFRPEDVVTDFMLPADQEALPTAAAAGGVPTITTKQAYDALPSGAIYVAPDGKTRRKR